MATDTLNLTENLERNIRSVFYKKPIKKGNYKLNIDFDETHQEIRRQQLLDYQKKRREEIINSARDIVSEELSSDGEINESLNRNDKKRYSKKYKKRYANKLMMSEWMFEVPENFIKNWSMVACPKGKRNLLVAAKGKTRAYNRRGQQLVEFTSALPGGHPEQNNKNCTILDCVWDGNKKVYYVLDILAWCNQPLLNCEAEFRRFWIKSKFEETENLKLRDTYENDYPILSLPSIRCDENLSEFLENETSFLSLDGLLFYHREGHYMHGRTPLVTWLKPFMLSEVLGISMPLRLDEKPLGYIDFRHHILSRANKKKDVSKCIDVSMDITDGDG